MARPHLPHFTQSQSHHSAPEAVCTPASTGTLPTVLLQRRCQGSSGRESLPTQVGRRLRGPQRGVNGFYPWEFQGQLGLVVVGESSTCRMESFPPPCLCSGIVALTDSGQDRGFVHLVPCSVPQRRSINVDSRKNHEECH